ncbi:MAG: response regulator [Candidatus Omnitrophota bacterium]
MPLKILIVDDDDLTLKLLTRRLESAGYKVIAAQTGEGAMKQVNLGKPDIILMDILLPDMQGSDAVKMLRERTDISKTRIIFLSSIISSDGENEQGIKVDGTFYPAIAKPIDFRLLKNLLD